MRRAGDVVVAAGARWAGLPFALPWLIGVVGLTLIPMVISLVLSFTSWDGLSLRDGVAWVGLRHYREMIETDAPFRRALGNSLYYTFGAVPLGVAWSLGVAMLLNARVRGRALFRTLFMLPAMLGGVATVMIWSWLLNPRFGLVNRMLAALYDLLDPLVRVFHAGGTSAWTAPDWFYAPAACKPALIIMHLWLGGASMMVFLAALQRVPTTLLEAAELDGAGPWRRFTSVTLWHLSPVILFNLVVGVVFSMQAFDQAYLLYNRAQDDGLLFYVLHLYRAAFEPPYRVGYASALGWTLFVVIAVLVLPLLLAARKLVFYEARR